MRVLLSEIDFLKFKPEVLARFDLGSDSDDLDVRCDDELIAFFLAGNEIAEEGACRVEEFPDLFVDDWVIRTQHGFERLVPQPGQIVEREMCKCIDEGVAMPLERLKELRDIFHVNPKLVEPIARN